MDLPDGQQNANLCVSHMFGITEIIENTRSFLSKESERIFLFSAHYFNLNDLKPAKYVWLYNTYLYKTYKSHFNS